jgi:hypothetical protein
MGGMCFPRGYIRLNRLQGGRPFKTALAAACALNPAISLIMPLTIQH